MNAIVEKDIDEILLNDLPWEEFNGSTVLITGAGGMVGQYLVALFCRLNETRGYRVEVLGLVRDEVRANKVLTSYFKSGLRLIVGDVADIDVDDAVDYIFHAASPANPIAFKKDPLSVSRANAQGAFNMLDIAKRDHAQFCLISTMEVYGQFTEPEVTVSEDTFGAIDPTQVRAAYPESKRFSENLAVLYKEQYDVDVVIARMTHTYGPGMDINDSRVQAEFMKQAIMGNEIVLMGDGSQRRTYTYILDAIAGVLFTVLKPAPGRVAYNIANENAKVSILELAEAIAPLGGSGVSHTKSEGTDRAWSPMRNVFVDCSLLRSLGWSATISLDIGVRRAYDYYKVQ